jgi:hypothetical protein
MREALLSHFTAVEQPHFRLGGSGGLGKENNDGEVFYLVEDG